MKSFHHVSLRSRSEVTSEFRKARYEALVADVKSEWNKLVH